MKRQRLLLAATLALAGAAAEAATLPTLTGQPPIVIAHRGASNYLPEHSLAAYELAMRMGADHVEPDLQLTKDGVLVAMHDDTLDRSTNAVALWGAGPHKVEDHTLAEIRTLTVVPTGPASNTFPGFTPSAPNAFAVPTFDEVLDFVNAYNAANGTSVGVYPEAKTPNRPDMNEKIVAQLEAKGFGGGKAVFIQSFSVAALKDIAARQLVEGTDMPLIALGGALNLGGTFFFGEVSGTLHPLGTIAGLADGLGLTIAPFNFGGLTNALGPDFIAAAHAAGLKVHAWTFESSSVADAEVQLAPLLAAGLDGFFTNNPDHARAAVDAALAPVPLPLPAGLLVAGLAALGAMRRRAA